MSGWVRSMGERFCFGLRSIRFQQNYKFFPNFFFISPLNSFLGGGSCQCFVLYHESSNLTSDLWFRRDENAQCVCVCVRLCFGVVISTRQLEHHCWHRKQRAAGSATSRPACWKCLQIVVFHKLLSCIALFVIA